MEVKQVTALETFSFPLIVRSIGALDSVVHSEFIYHSLARLPWKKKLDGRFHHSPVLSVRIKFKEDQFLHNLEIIQTVPAILSDLSEVKNLSDEQTVSLHHLWKAMLPDDFKVFSDAMDSGEYDYEIKKIDIFMKVSENGIEYNTDKFSG